MERLLQKLDKSGERVKPSLRFIDVEFSKDYKLRCTHAQRIVSEFRMPLYEGFTVPSSTFDSDTAAMFKSLLLHALSAQVGDDLEHVRFAALCDVPGSTSDPNQPFTFAWLAHVPQQKFSGTIRAQESLKHIGDPRSFGNDVVRGVV